MTICSTATEVRPAVESQLHSVGPTSATASKSSHEESITFVTQAPYVPTFRIGSAGLAIHDAAIKVFDLDNARTFDEDVRAQVSALWAEDWDNADDSVYDDW